jgi:hypothetical protein
LHNIQKKGKLAREHGATDHEITRSYLRVSAGLRPNALAFQDLDAYAAAWRDALVKELRAYKAMVDHCLSAVLERRFDDEGRQDASQGAQGARSPRAAVQRRARGAEVGTVALSQPRRAPFLVIKFGLSSSRGLWRACSSFDNLAKSSRARAITKGSHLGLSAPKAPALFSNDSNAECADAGHPPCTAQGYALDSVTCRCEPMRCAPHRRLMHSAGRVFCGPDIGLACPPCAVRHVPVRAHALRASSAADALCRARVLWP